MSTVHLAENLILHARTKPVELDDTLSKKNSIKEDIGSTCSFKIFKVTMAPFGTYKILGKKKY